ncbi:MAG: YihA family ribosome biogenesis GTP-binding protein [Alphaproteobacteria bacterium]|nr:YihA family ribosome biogenesis GTP-binding protein [Alphaproteobacteria bacterium]
MTADVADDTNIEEGRKLFSGPCDFVLGITDLAQLPPADLPEIAFVGRSNVGKSSLMNALTGRKALARVSHTPGRTQQLNFFDLGGVCHLVDMPGYGYAKVSKQQRKAWDALIFDYLKGRPNLRTVFVLIDSRHGVKDSDGHVFDLLDAAAVNYRIVLTKADKARPGALAETIAETETALKKHPAAFPSVMTTSAHEDEGIAELRSTVRLCAL